MQLTLCTLGTLQASTTDAQGNTRALSRGKPVAMLAYLACIPGHKASREHLAALLWGDVDSDAARQNLRQTIWYLKKKLGDGLLDATGEVLGLAASFTCDRDEFFTAAHHADFAGAVQRHSGPFIPDFAAPGASEFEQWCELERRRVTVTFLRCVDTLARQWLSEGKFRDAQEIARRARDVDPMDQATWRLLLEALVAGSDGLGATSEAEHFEAFLAREEQDPDSASLAVMRAARRSPAAPGPDTTGYASSIAAELVGREAEFSHVLSAWEQARGGAARVLVVSAMAGLGKSRLLRDVQARLRASRSRCLLVRANPGDRHLSDGFLAEVVSQVAMLPGSAAVSTGSAGVLVALAPALASTYASATPDNSDGEEAVRRRALALVDLIRAVSDEHAVALLLDDLHWADDHSARVIAAALSRVEHSRLLVVMTKRPVADPRALFTTFEQLALPPLDLAAVTAFVAHAAELPTAPWADLLPQQLLLATGGSPLLLVETLHDALEQGWLSCSAVGVWQCPDPSRVTISLREGSAVQQRVLRLAPCPRRVLLVLAVVGRPIEFEDALSMVGGDSRSFEEHVETLERGGFLIRQGALLTVAHDEIADAAMGAASDAERRTVNIEIARVQLTRPADEFALRRAAEHAAAAGDEPLITQVWLHFLILRRRQGDRRGTARVAADLFGCDVTSDRVRAMVSVAPLRKRRRTRWMVAASVVLVAALMAVTAMVRRPAPRLTEDFAVWVVDSVTGEKQLVGVRLDPDAPWLDGTPIEAVELDISDFPRLPELGRVPVYRLPDGRGWWSQTTVPGLGDEVRVIDSLGMEHLPLRGLGDDAVSGLSPDGQRFVALTARFDTVTDHMQVVTVGVYRGPLTRLTKSPDYEREASWRPDGTQIAFRRHFYEEMLPDRVCLIDVDGSNERCLAVPIAGEYQLLGWMNERRLLLTSMGGTFMSLDVATERFDPIDGMVGRVLNSGGELRVCLCHPSAEGEASLYLFRKSQLASARPVLYRGRPLRGALAIVGSVYRDREWLDTLRIHVPASGLSVDNVHRLTVDGRRANGAPAWLHDLRWTSRDTSVASVDSTGRLRPRRLGETWIVVSAGGWRSDSALARITPPASRTAMQERWSSNWKTRWAPFGIPEAIVVQTDRGPALLPNGDGSYPSGAYSRHRFAATTGAGIEVVVRLPVTRAQWQTLQVQLIGGDALPQFDHWDHRTGAGPIVSTLCELGAPGDEGAMGLGFVTLSAAGNTKPIPVPPGFFAAKWHVIRLQIMEDGRCALALDGRAAGIVSSRSRGLPSTAIVNLMGHDRFGGRLVVGPLDAWSGVRGGVDWTLIDADTTVKKP